VESLQGKVAVVTGASRGLGRGIALGLGQAGATVYVTGRSLNDDHAASPSRQGGIAGAAAEVTRLGGVGIAVRCDHHVDADVEALFSQVSAEQGGLDILVNNVFASPAQRVLWGGQRFWQIPVKVWDDVIDVGLRSHFVATRAAIPLLINQGGLVVNVSSHFAAAGKAPGSPVIVPYSVGKAALHRLSADMAVELRDFGVAVVSVWPPPTQTEGVLAEQDVFGDVSTWKEPLFTGRVVAAFAARGDCLARSGEALVIEDLAHELGVVTHGDE
jgi:dehydrogenase/reductase SDR family protein 1